MNHEELLEKINIRAAWEEKRSDGTTILVIDYDDAPNTKALRAVVELHKPFMGNTLELCKECSQLRKVDDPVITYPCPTIQTIEKELE
jgi:anaerobic ribonucleoside-triphosphate reductase